MPRLSCRSQSEKGLSAKLGEIVGASYALRLSCVARRSAVCRYSMKRLGDLATDCLALEVLGDSDQQVWMFRSRRRSSDTFRCIWSDLELG
nr:hypothetical protein CFP56_67029 [Quercus suber]